MELLKTTILDLDHALSGEIELLIGGGLGLYFKQGYLQRGQMKTLLPAHQWPQARTTEDIDLFLPVEIVTDSAHMGVIHQALETLGFASIESAQYFQFTRPMDRGTVKIDLMAGPLGEFESRVRPDSTRVQPRPSVQLHARRAEDALGVEDSPLPIKLAGRRSDGAAHDCIVLIPQAFPYVLMKLMALRDRINDPNKDEGRHHALDLFRIIGMLTEDEDAFAAQLAARFDSDPVLIEAREVGHDLFGSSTGRGRIRLREHPLFPGDTDMDWFATELARILEPPQDQPR